MADYCGRICQTAAWREHKLLCKAPSEAPAAGDAAGGGGGTAAQPPPPKRHVYSLLVNDADLGNECAVCKKVVNIRKAAEHDVCAGCRKVVYCGENCMGENWELHGHRAACYGC